MNENENFSVLIVDDNTQNLQVLADVLERCGIETGFAMTGKQAIDYVRVEKPDLILLDVMMPEMDGYEACSIIKSDPNLADIPIIFLTAKVETEDIVKGFDVGGVDYISKPFNSAELKSRVKTHLELKKVQDDLKKSFKDLREAKDVIERQNDQLGEMMKKLEISSRTDPLTGLFNRRSMIEVMEREQAKNSDKNFSIVMADIDFFKCINDTYGHDCGDAVLKTISEYMGTSIRKEDYLSRWGGEEFLIMFTSANIKEAVVLAERIRNKLAEFEFNFKGAIIKFTMTFGVSEFIKGESLDEIIKRADEALYEGKRTGKNKVVAK